MPKAKIKIREKDVLKACLDWLARHKCYVWRNNTGAYKINDGSGRFIRYGLKGSPDIIGVSPFGRFIGIECKGTGGKVSDAQKAFGKRVEENGGLYIVAYSTDDLEPYKHLMTKLKPNMNTPDFHKCALQAGFIAMIEGKLDDSEYVKKLWELYT